MSKIKFGTFLTALLKKAGVDFDATKPENADLLSSSIEIPQELVTKLNEGLLTVDSAAANTTVRDRILAASLGAFDNDLLKKAEELGLTELVTEFATEKSTRKKAMKLIETALEVEKKKSGEPAKDKKKYEEDIAALNATAKKLREDAEAEKKSLLSKHDQELNDLLLENMLSGYDYADNEFGREFVLRYAKDSTLQAVNNNKAKLVRDGKALKLVNAETGADVFDAQNNKVELKGLVDSSVAKLLKKSDAPNPQKQEIVIPADGKVKGDAKTAEGLTQLAAELSAQA